MRKYRIPILVSSTDSFEDCWLPFFTLLKKYWPDFDGEIYLVAETKEFTFDGLNIISIKTSRYFPKKPTWSQSFMKAIDLIDHDYFLLLLDDLFIYDYVKTDLLQMIIKLAIENNIAYIGLGTNSGPFNPSGFPELLEIDSSAKYRISLLPFIFNKTKFKKYIRSYETPWQLEIFGSKRSSFDKEMFYSIDPVKYGENNIIPYPKRSGIIRGKWNKEVGQVFRDNDIAFDPAARGIFDPSAIRKNYSKYLSFDYTFSLIKSRAEILGLQLKNLIHSQSRV